METNPLVVIVTSIISLFLEHFVWMMLIIGALVFFYIIGTRKKKNEQKYENVIDAGFEEINK